MPMMDWTGDNVSENFRLYKRKLNLYFEDEGITDKTQQARKVLRTIGDKGLRLLFGSPLSDNDQKDPKKLLQFFDTQIPQTLVNFRIHRMQLMRLVQDADESLDNFITRIRTFAQRCDFTEEEIQERVMELVIAGTPHEEFRKELLPKPKGFALKNMLELGRRYEAIAKGAEQLKQLGLTERRDDDVDAVHQRKFKRKSCDYCGTQHAKKECPAYTSKCKVCGKVGHWAKMCYRKEKLTVILSEKTTLRHFEHI